MKPGILFIALSGVVLTVRGHSQDIEPRRWSHLPTGSNFLGGAYAYTTGDIFLDPVLRIEDAEFDLHTVGLKYIRSFEMLGKSARFEILQAYHDGRWTGLLDGAPASAERDGWGDTHLRFAVNLLGAPPLSGQEFAAYQSRTEPETILGAALAVQLPTGEYFDDKLINLGSNRFSFRPQIGLMHTWSKWSLEATAALWFFTDNDEFFGGKRLEQDPAFVSEANLIYNFKPGFWMSGSVGYAGGGETTVDGKGSDNAQSSLGWGVSAGIPISRAVALKIAYINLCTFASTGLDSSTITCGITVRW